MLRSKGGMRRRLNTGKIMPNASLKIAMADIPQTVKNPVKSPVQKSLHETWDAPNPGAKEWGFKTK